MKIFYTFLLGIIALLANAQAPQGFNYQATVRNNAGALMTNASVQLKFSILKDTATGTIVYSESQTKTTDGLGQVSTVVGQGTALTGTFAAINWGTGTHFLAIELNTGNGFVAMGTTQLLSVPYALYANSSGSTTGSTGGFTHYVGELFGGGIVVSVWKDAQGVEHGLIASLTDLSVGIPWATPAFQETEIGSSAQSSKDGLSNTNAIVAQAGAGTTYAAGLCKAYNAGGFTDWYLPAINELKVIFNSLPQLDNSQLLIDSSSFQNLSAPNYLSSTENEYFIWYLNFYSRNMISGVMSNGGRKDEYYAVRAVRRF